MGPDKEDFEIPKELVDFIRTGSKFIIAGHKEPDGDCVGSQLALCSALKRLGKQAIVCSAGPFKRTEINNYSEQFVSVLSEADKSDAKVIVVDCTSIDRVGSIQESLEGLPRAIIDHHETGNYPASTQEAPVFINPNAPACTFIIERLIAALGLELTKEEAQILLFGLCTDTGFFRHLTEKDAAVLNSAANMVRHGASPKNTYKIMNDGKTLNSRLLIGIILSRTEPHFDGKLLISHETEEEYKKFGYEGRDSDSLNKMLLSVEGVEAVIIIRQECADNCTVSLRSVDKIDVAHIASVFGGGGHKNASGLTMQGTISSVKQVMLDAFSKFFV